LAGPTPHLAIFIGFICDSSVHATHDYRAAAIPLGQEKEKEEKMDSGQVEQVGPQRSQQLTILEIIFAGAITAILAGGVFTLWTTMVGITLLLALHAYDTKADFSRAQSAAFSAVWALSVILTIGVLFNVLGPDKPLWSDLVYACKQGGGNSELASEQIADPVYVCSDGPFVKPDSLEGFLAGIYEGENPAIPFMIVWLLSGSFMFVYRRNWCART
jgi:hypothetical protein